MNSFLPVEIQQNIWVDSKNYRYRNFSSITSPLHHLCIGRIRFRTHASSFSDFPSDAMLWIIKNHRDQLQVTISRILKCWTRRLLLVWTRSSRIKRVSLEEQKSQKEDRFLRGRQIAYLIYDHFRVTGSHDSVENFTNLFTTVLRNDDVEEFDSKWDGILVSLTKIPHDDILEGLYKLRIRESEKLKTVLELYDLETHQKKLGPDYHRSKLWWREVSGKKFEIRIWEQNWKFWEERRGQESGNKTACTKNSWRLLAMGNQRAMCERRQLQFPPRYQ